MKISVIILNWNRPEDTIKATESVLRQDHPSYEVLVWDNASSDDSLDRLRRRFAGDPRVRIVAGDANYGVAGGRNRAFALATGEVLLSLDSDAWFDADQALRRIDTRLAADASIGAISFEVKRPDQHLMWPFARPAGEWRSREFDTIRVDGCSFAVHRAAYDRVGSFAEHFSPYGAEDQHFALSLLGLGYRILYFPQVVVIHAFATTGRTPLQFRRHVRNSLWIPMELFPMPQAALSFLKLAVSLFRDALEQKRVLQFASGVGEALTGFRLARRRSMSRSTWRAFRRLVAEDKALARRDAP